MHNFLHSECKSMPCTLLIASPMARDREYLRNIAERCDMLPIEATTYREALWAVGIYGPVAVVCDESLPWRDIVSYLADGCDPPRVIVVSAVVESRLFAEVLNVGGFDVVTKPFSEAEIRRVLSSARSSSSQTFRRPPAADSRTPARPQLKRA